MADNTDVFQSFLVAVGFDVKSADAAKVQDAVKKVEAALTITVQTETQKRVEAEKAAAEQRAKTNEHLQTLVTQGEAEALEKREKAKRDQDNRDKKRDDDKAKREQQQRDRDLKATQEFNRKLAESAVNAVKTIRDIVGAKAVMGVARDLLSVTDQAAKNFERLGYMSSRVGSSAASISAFGYAASQTGSSASEAQAGLEAFSRNMRMNEQGRANQLRDLLGVQARGRDGKLRDSSDILADVGDSLRQRSRTPQGYAQSVNIAQALGIDENLLRAITNPEFRKRVDEFRKDNSVAGANQDEAARGGREFSQAVRHVVDIIDAVKTRVETGLFQLVAPQLEKIAKWIDDHSQQISNFIDTLAKNLIDLGTAFANSDVVKSALESLQSGLEWTAKYVASDDFKRDVTYFVEGIKSMAASIRKALEFLGLVGPARAKATAEDDAKQSALAAFDPSTDPATHGQGIWNRGFHGRGLRGAYNDDDNKARVDGKLGQFRGGHGIGKTTAAMEAGARESFNFWKSKGLSDEQAAGLVGMEQGESQFDPRAVGDGGSAHGAFQHHADRRRNIKSATGIDIDTATHLQQLEAAHWEFTQSKDSQARDAWEKIKSAKTAHEAAAIGVYGFERPGDKRGQAEIRGGMAEGWLNRFSGSGGDPAKTVANFKNAGLLTDEQCVTLAMAAVGIRKGQGPGGNVHDWVKGEGAESGNLAPGTPVATFLNRDGSQSDRYAGGGAGTPGAHLDHAGVFQKYLTDEAGKRIGMQIAEQFQGSNGVHLKNYMFGHGFGEANGSNYHAVLGPGGSPLGQSKPVKVEVTDSSAAKIGKMTAEDRAAVIASHPEIKAQQDKINTDRAKRATHLKELEDHAAALSTVARAKSGHLLPHLHRPLGTGHLAMTDHSRSVALSQANVYNVTAHRDDVPSLMAQTEVHASRGVQDLIRNTRSVEA